MVGLMRHHCTVIQDLLFKGLLLFRHLCLCLVNNLLFSQLDKT